MSRPERASGFRVDEVTQQTLYGLPPPLVSQAFGYAVRFFHEVPMTEFEWLSSTDPAAMWEYLRSGLPGAGSAGATYPLQPCLIRVSDRKLRLFACACCRQVWDGGPCGRCGGLGEVERYEGALPDGQCSVCGGTGRVGGLTDPRSRRAVEVAERFADGEATVTELSQARQAAACASAETYGELDSVRTPFFDAADCANETAIEAAQVVIANPMTLTPATQAALLRDIFGNPWRPVASVCGEGHYGGRCCDCCPLLTRTVRDMAALIYAERRFGDLPILADAMEDAGCDGTELLGHLRDPGPHARGCWVVDLILGKE